MVGAAQYMQVTESQRRNTETLARNLKDLMDRYFSEPITSISDSPDGALDDGVPIDRERVGPLTVGASKTDITLVRVTDPQAGHVWLISSETLAQIPALRRSIARTWIERVMPTTLHEPRAVGDLARTLDRAGRVLCRSLRPAHSRFGRIHPLCQTDPQRSRTAPQCARVVCLHSVARDPRVGVGHSAVGDTLSGIPAGVLHRLRTSGSSAGIALTWLVRRVLTLAFARAAHRCGGGTARARSLSAARRAAGQGAHPRDRRHRDPDNCRCEHQELRSPASDWPAWRSRSAHRRRWRICSAACFS